MSLYTGLRIGELLALTWQDVDFDRGVISVTKNCRDSWEDGRYVKILDTPKTATSNREIPLPCQMFPLVEVAKKESGDSEYVVNDKGEVISIRSHQRTFELMLKKLGLPHRGFHSLRHTFATRAIECGMDVKTLSEIMEHSNPSITLKRYAHSLVSHKKAMMDKLGKNILNGIEKIECQQIL